MKSIEITSKNKAFPLDVRIKTTVQLDFSFPFLFNNSKKKNLKFPAVIKARFVIFCLWRPLVEHSKRVRGSNEQQV